MYGLYYLADIFTQINKVNRAIQGPDVIIMDAADKLKAFMLKLPLRKRRWELHNYANFSILKDVILRNETKKECNIFISMRKEFCSQLDILQTFFEDYFNSGSWKGEAWNRNPFPTDLNRINNKGSTKLTLLIGEEASFYTLNLVLKRWKSFGALNNNPANLWQSKQLGH